MAHSGQLTPRTEVEDVVMKEDFDREERMSSSYQDNAIENQPVDDSESNSDTEVNEMKPRSLLKKTGHKTQGQGGGKRLWKNFENDH